MSGRLIGVALILALAYFGRNEIVATTKKILSRGLRNNNPGNIRHSSANWLGKSVTQTDDQFVTFDSAEYGLRALAVTLRTYFDKYGLNTVRKIISRWAPSNENDTQAYINAVAKGLNVNPDQPLNFTTHLPGLIAGIVKHENGTQPFSFSVINRAISMM